MLTNERYWLKEIHKYIFDLAPGTERSIRYISKGCPASIKLQERKNTHRMSWNFPVTLHAVTFLPTEARTVLRVSAQHTTPLHQSWNTSVSFQSLENPPFPPYPFSRPHRDFSMVMGGEHVWGLLWGDKLGDWPPDTLNTLLQTLAQSLHTGNTWQLDQNRIMHNIRETN